MTNARRYFEYLRQQETRLNEWRKATLGCLIVLGILAVIVVGILVLGFLGFPMAFPFA
jgi:hypothetical protein